MEVVSYEISKKLKEKGFNTEFKYSLGYYDTLGNFMSAADHWFLDSWIIAPTISQVLKWLRKEHQIHIFVDITSVGWYPKVSTKVKLDETRFWFSKAPFFESDFFDTYEEAVLAPIEYVIDKLI